MLVAPAGYGKTTALAQWVEADHRDAVWVTVETSDNDPARMLDQIGIALRHLDGDSALVARPRPSRGLTVADLVEQVRKRGRPVLLALDDVHHLHRTPVPNLLVELATRLPAGSQVAMASRTHSPLRLGRLRAERLCAEVGPADLAFDAGEAAGCFARAGINVSPEDVLRLLDRTEGWPAGIYLAAVALRDRVDLTAAPDRFSGDDAYIADFFRDELMAGESPETVRFLLRTSVLGSLSAELSDAVLGTTDSADRLAEIEQRNLFLVPLDHRREWYRYHRLFAETLTAELRRREPGEEQRVHRRAADWYEQQGMVEQAVAHWNAGSEPTKVALSRRPVRTPIRRKRPDRHRAWLVRGDRSRCGGERPARCAHRGLDVRAVRRPRTGPSVSAGGGPGRVHRPDAGRPCLAALGRHPATRHHGLEGYRTDARRRPGSGRAGAAGQPVPSGGRAHPGRRRAPLRFSR